MSVVAERWLYANVLGSKIQEVVCDDVNFSNTMRSAHVIYGLTNIVLDNGYIIQTISAPRSLTVIGYIQLLSDVQRSKK